MGIGTQLTASAGRYTALVTVSDVAGAAAAASVAGRSVLTRPAGPDDAAILQRLYEETPGYFEIISIPLPEPTETRTELLLAQADGRRRVEVILAPNGDTPADWRVHDDDTGLPAVGVLDYKLDYPQAGDATVNLLLIPPVLQSRGYGRACITLLETRLAGRCRRLLAAIYGQNPRAEQFWKSLGYSFAIDAKPNLDWYAKELAV